MVTTTYEFLPDVFFFWVFSLGGLGLTCYLCLVLDLPERLTITWLLSIIVLWALSAGLGWWSPMRESLEASNYAYAFGFAIGKHVAIAFFAYLFAILLLGLRKLGNAVDSDD